MKLARYLVTHYDAGEPKFVAGKHYPVSDETARHVSHGIAEEVDIEIDVSKIEKLRAGAAAADEKAAGSAAAAKADAQAAADAAAAVRVVEDMLAAGEPDTAEESDKGDEPTRKKAKK